MKVLLINPPYQTLTSNLGVGHQVPLGLLMVGGSLIDAGQQVKLLDAECLRLEIPTIAKLAHAWAPAIVMTGHAGSTPAHPVCMNLLAALRLACPDVVTVYGGVYPTYHAEQILREHPAVDYIVRGEGEATVVELVRALETASPEERNDACKEVHGLAFRGADKVHCTPPRPSIANLDDYRIGWELIEDWDRYQCFGLGRAAIIQLSRGCPHRWEAASFLRMRTVPLAQATRLASFHAHAGHAIRLTAQSGSKATGFSRGTDGSMAEAADFRDHDDKREQCQQEEPDGALEG